MSKQTEISEEKLRTQKMQYALEQFKHFSNNYLTISDSSSSSGRRGSGNYTAEKLNSYLENPEQYSDDLVNFSRYLYSTSATYNKIINFYATLPTYAYVVDSIEEITSDDDLEIVRKNYQRVLELLEKMSLRHELQKLMKVAYKEDVFYGYEMETSKSYYILHMNPDLCKITSIEDGVFNYSFNFSIFDGNEELLLDYPEEFEKLYREYQRSKDKTDDGFMELDSKKAFAIKINEDVTYPLPPFSSSMVSAIEEQDYKKIKKNKDALDNFMALVQHIPLDDKQQGMDAFKIELDLAMQFHSLASGVLPDGVGLITSPMKIEAVKLEKSKRDDDLVMQSKDNTLSDAGLPPNIFSTTNKTAGGIKYAVQYLEQVSFAPLRQIERWINRKLKRLSGRHKFKIRFLDVTNFSRNDVFDKYLKGAQFGFPVKQEVAATLDISPLNFSNKLVLENDLLGLNEEMIPLSSSHTQSASSGDSEVGRTKEDDQDISESTEVWRENNPDN